MRIPTGRWTEPPTTPRHRAGCCQMSAAKREKLLVALGSALNAATSPSIWSARRSGPIGRRY
jgi:hypothetical protein